MLGQVDSDDYVVIHSALHTFGLDIERLKWELLEAIKFLERQSKTILIPAFTFEFTKGRTIQHPIGELDTGNFANWCMELHGAVRTAHPIYSFVVIGKGTNEILNCSLDTAFGERSVFGLLTRKNTRLVMYGCGWAYCTQFHYYEEKHGVPYRKYKTFSGNMEVSGQNSAVKTQMYVRDSSVNVTNDFGPLVALIRKNGYLRKGESGIVESVSINDLGKVCSELLEKDLYSLVSYPRIIENRVRQKYKLESSEPYEVYIYGSKNNELLGSALQEKLSEHLKDRLVVTTIPPYGQHRQVLFQSKSKTYNCIVFVENLEHLEVTDEALWDSKKINSTVSQYAKEIEHSAKQLSELVIVNLFYRTKTDPQAFNGNISMYDYGNKVLVDNLMDCKNVVLVDTEQLSLSKGIPIVDDRLRYLAQIPIGNQFCIALANRYVGAALAYLGKSIRLLLLDLDNTLWGGVIGEDDIEGIDLGGDYPGNCYKDFQRSLKLLSDNGLALGLVSKNNNRDALNVIKNHPEMILKIKDFSITKINWNRKVDNIRAIATEMGLGLENIGLLDDNPIERDEVRQYLPQVKVIDLPDEPTKLCRFLENQPYLQSINQTKEDKNRVRSYRQIKSIKEAEKRFDDRTSFLKHLEVKIFIQDLDEFNVSRAHQMIRKTNQFNSTCERVPLAKLTETNKTQTIVVGGSDRYFERENIGLIRITIDKLEKCLTIVQFLMSCRALGKGIEEELICWLLRQGQDQGIETIKALFVSSERNQPVEILYRKGGLLKGKKQIRTALNKMERISYGNAELIDLRGKKE